MNKRDWVFMTTMVSLILVCLIALFYVVHTALYHPSDLLRRPRYQFKSDAEEQQFLNKWYAATNEVYFYNKLPKDTKIEVREIPPDVNADFTIAQTTPLGNGRYLVTIDPRFNLSANQEALSLDHEDCHIALMQQNGDADSKHGIRFQTCMQRLAADGAFRELW